MSKRNDPTVGVFPKEQFFLERFRIHQLLEQALKGHVLIICAGEGCGKTYAVSSFLQRWSETTTWIQFSERDNNPWRFWENYTKAMGHCKARAGRELRDVGFPETAQQFAKWFEICRREFSSPGKYVIVGDDFHRIKSRPVLDFIERAMHFPIPNHTLILICRSEPALNMVPVLSKGRLTRIDAEELLFTREEITGYFRLRGIDLSPEEIAAIHRDTEGWPLAMGLVAAEIQKNGGRYTQPVPESGVLKFFEDVLFASIPKELQRYLIRLSLFEQWPLELLERIAVMLPEQYRDMPVLITELEKFGAIIRYDYYLRGYRINQVFLDYLRKKQQKLSKTEIQQTCAIAAQWCLENNLKMDAALHCMRAGDYAGFIDIIDTFPQIVPPGAAAPLLELIERMMENNGPKEDNDYYIYLYRVVRGRLLMCLSRINEAEAVFQESIRHFEALPLSPSGARVLAESWFCRGIITLLVRSRFDGNVSYISCLEQADRYYRLHPWPLSKSMTRCAVSSYVLQVGCSAKKGDFERRIRAFVEGAPRAADSLCGCLAGLDDLALTELAYFRGEFIEAEQYARKTIIKARERRQYEIEHRALFYLLRIIFHRGSLEDLMETMKQKDILVADNNYPNRGTINDIIDGWLYTQLGMPQKAAAWLRSRFETGELYSMFLNYESLVKAKYLFAENQFTETTDFLNLKENREGLGTYLLGMIEMNCLEAAARLRQGEERAALALLEKLYTAAVSNAICVPFIELGYDMRSLATMALNSGSVIPRPWLEDIRSRASAYGKNLSAIAEQLRGRAAAAPVYLTRQERAVLNGLSRGQTRDEIAAAVGQPLSAVKSLISRICEKLGAVNRADAVRIASGMGLLG
jgi:LuxR family maltose regulon positive regulatory protein